MRRAALGRPRERRPLLHWTLYAVVIVVPLLGWAGISDFGAREVRPGYRCRRSGRKVRATTRSCCEVHAYSAFALLALVALHVGIAIHDSMTAGRPGGPTHGE